MIRNVSECKYGITKQWEIVHGTIPYQRRDCIGDILDVLASTENEFFVTLRTDTAERDRYATRILLHASVEIQINHTQRLIPQRFGESPLIKAGWYPKQCSARHKLAYYIQTDVNCPDYNLIDVEELAMGKYTLKRADEYMMKFIDRLELWIYSQQPNTYLFNKIAGRYTDDNKMDNSKKKIDDVALILTILNQQLLRDKDYYICTAISNFIVVAKVALVFVIPVPTLLQY